MSGYRMDTTEFDTLAYGMPNMHTVDYIRQGLNTMVQAITPIGQQFMQRVQGYIDDAYNSNAMRKMRAALGKVDTQFQPNTILEYTTLAQFQNAQPVMQRYLMAVPGIQRMYEDQRIDGYSGTYHHTQEGLYRHDNYNYRRMMHGMMYEEDGEIFATEYQEDLYEGDRHLTVQEQTILIHTGESAEAILRQGLDDLTSREGGSL